MFSMLEMCKMGVIFYLFNLHYVLLIYLLYAICYTLYILQHIYFVSRFYISTSVFQCFLYFSVSVKLTGGYNKKAGFATNTEERLILHVTEYTEIQHFLYFYF